MVLRPDTLAKLRQKYPQYHDLSDVDLSQRIVKKYPEYRDLLVPASSGHPVDFVPDAPPAAQAHPQPAHPPGLVQRVESTIANLPGVKQAGDVFRQTLGAPATVVHVDFGNAQSAAVFGILQRYGFSADEAGNLFDPNGKPVTQSQADFLMSSFIPAGCLSLMKHRGWKMPCTLRRVHRKGVSNRGFGGIAQLHERGAQFSSGHGRPLFRRDQRLFETSELGFDVEVAVDVQHPDAFN